MSKAVALRDLLDFTRDGEWGKGEPEAGLMEMAVIRGTDFADARFGTVPSVPRRFIPKHIAERKILRPGDILLETAGGTKDQPTGRTLYLSDRLINRLQLPVTCASFSRFLRVKPELIDAKYLFWFLQWLYETGVMLPYHIQHTGVARFQYTDFAAQPLILVPDFREQKAIAAALSALDDKIELNRRMNETLERIAQAIFRHWFVDFGPVRRKLAGLTNPTEIMGGLVQDAARAKTLAALFPDAMGDNGLPVGWEEQPLLEAARLISGGTPKTDNPAYWDGEIRWASAKDVSQCGALFLLSSERSITDLGLKESSTKLVPKMATVVVARGATTGRYCMFGAEMAMNQTCYALSSQTGHSVWLHLAFGTLVERLVGAAHGSVFDTITTTTLQAVTVIQAEKQLMDAFEELVAPLYQKALANSGESQNLAATRDLLLPKLMSGEIRLRDAEAMAGSAT
jgi:type I restriction enzyme, S subunit